MEYEDRAELHVKHAVLLKILGQKKEANVAAKRALTLSTATEQVRAALKKEGLPEQEMRIVSFAQSESDKFFGEPVMKGVVINGASETASYVRIIVECKDDSGALTGTGTGYVEPTTLTAGESGSFEIYVKGPLSTHVSCTARVANEGP